MAGVYTYAGHWSETPDYMDRRQRSIKELFSSRATPEMRQAFLKDSRADFILAPMPGAIPGLNSPNLESLGSVVVKGTDFELIRVARVG
jgi:arabinosyltransferase C